MRRTLAAVLLSLVALGAQAQTSAGAAREELNAGARLYREGDFASAEWHFRRALELDPSIKNARLFIARAVHQQYKPGVRTPENMAAGERAVAAYAEVLREDPLDDDAYKATLFLYGTMKNDAKVVEMLTRRAGADALAPEKRAEAYVILASRHWQCSYDITEQGANKETVRKPDRVLVKYKMPADASDFDKARQCAAEGLRLSELAVGLDPNSANAWSYKTNLLREAAKLAEMEGDEAGAAEYRRQYDEGLERHRLLSDRARETAEAADAQGRAETSAPREDSGRRKVISGGVLNGKAVSKPAPVYTGEAQGVVAVTVLVDEEGRVVSAEAVSGHELLRPAAEAAARLARFSPTRLSGEPVRVKGILTYNFVRE